MGLFEILFERANPGKIGVVEKNSKRPEPVDPSVLIIQIIISLIFIWLVYHVTTRNYLSLGNVIKFVAIMSGYCILSYYIIPKPDTSNIGWLGGFIDNPFRYSDDLNRILFVFLIIMYPGRFVFTTLLQCISFAQDRS